jgi:hypothetical protein
MPVLFLRELMSDLAHHGNTGETAEDVRRILAPFGAR